MTVIETLGSSVDAAVAVLCEGDLARPIPGAWIPLDARRP